MGGSESERKISWIKWSTICQSKNLGGLGVRDLECFNMALLGKRRWRLLGEGNRLWVRVLESRWGKSWVEGYSGGARGRLRKPLGWWGGVIKAVGGGEEGWFDEGLERVVGNGENTLFWWHKWVGSECLKDRFNRLFRLSLDKEAKIFEMGEWSGIGSGGGEGH